MKEYIEFMERAKLGRPQVDESLCFICQMVEPTKEVTSLIGKFNCCDNCIQQTLVGNAIFTMTLGMNPISNVITVRDIEKTN